MKTNATLARPARNVVLHSEAGEHLYLPVVHLGGNGNFQDALGRPQNLPQARIQLQTLRRHIKLDLRYAERIQILARSYARNHRGNTGLGDRGHGLSVLSCTRRHSNAIECFSLTSSTWPDIN